MSTAPIIAEHRFYSSSPGRRPTRCAPGAVSGPAVALSALLALAAGLAAFTATLAPRGGSLVWSDGLAYFLYARSAVVDHDTDLTAEFNELDARHPSGAELMIALRDVATRHPGTGRISVPWPVGSGLVLAPFYAVGYGVELQVARLLGREPDSYGLIPQYVFCLGSIAFALLGFWTTFLCCRRVAADRVGTAYLSVVALVLGGPLACYIFFNPSMAHASSFGLAGLFTLLWWRRWHDGAGRLAVLGLLLGIMITVRYQNGVFGILLLAATLRDLGRRPAGRMIDEVVSTTVALAVPLAFQLMHYIDAHGLSLADLGRQASGAFLIEQNAFDFRSPNFLRVLVSPQHGAFYWSPVMALGVLGLGWAARRSGWAWILLATFAAHVLLIGSLVGGSSGELNWSGGAAFGMRYLAECAPLLAIGLAALAGAARPRWGTALWASALAILVTWNGLLLMAYGLGTISRLHGVTYPVMANGVLAAARRLVAGM